MFILKPFLAVLALTGAVIGSPTPAEKRQASAIIGDLNSLASTLVTDGKLNNMFLSAEWVS